MKFHKLYLAAIVFASSFGSSLKAQYTYSNSSSDLIYHSVATVKQGNSGGFQEGYGFAYTNSNASPIRPEFIRTDEDGALMNAVYYSEYNGNDHRILHIEDISDENLPSDKQFLVVGTVDYGGSSALSVAILDEQGNIMNQNHFTTDAAHYFTGVKGVYNEESNEIAVIGLASDGFALTDSKEIVLMGLDTDLNLQWQVMASSAHLVNDHDFATDLTPIGPHEYAIVGTSNDATAVTSLPASMVVMADQGGVFGSYNHTFFNGFGSYDNVAAVVGMPQFAGDLWVMSNVKFFGSNFITIMHTDYVGNVIDYRYINAGTSKLVGFNLEPLDDERLAISGYRYTSTNEAIPFYMRYDRINGSIIDQYEYPTIGNTGITAYVDNNLLFMQAAQSDIPYFYNEMSTEKFDTDGIVFTANDDTYSTGFYGLKAYGVDPDGNYSSSNSCGLSLTNHSTITHTPTQTPISNEIQIEINEEGDYMFENALSINEDDCGPLYKMAGSSSNLADLGKASVNLFPNPASNEINVTNLGGATSISIHDISGKFIKEEILKDGDDIVTIDDVEVGIYIVKIMKGDELIQTEKIQIIK